MARRNQHLVVTLPQSPSNLADQAALESDTRARAEYVAEFKKWEEAIHADLWGLSSDSEAARRERLTEAQSRLDSIEDGPRHEVESMAEELEGKLQELIDALRGNWRGRTFQAGSRRPQLGASDEHLTRLMRPVAEEERRILFCGKIESVVQAYSDPKTALVKSIGDKQLTRMTKQAVGFSKHARVLGHHFLLSEVADRGLRAATEAAIAANEALVARLTALISGAEGTSLRSLLEANGNQLRNQFTYACAVVCLTVYGNVSIDHLRRLRCLKHLDYLTALDTNFIRSLGGDADRKSMERQIDLALSTVRKLADKQHPPIERVLALFEIDPVIGRGRERNLPKPDDTGLAEYALPGGG